MNIMEPLQKKLIKSYLDKLDIYSNISSHVDNPKEYSGFYILTKPDLSEVGATIWVNKNVVGSAAFSNYYFNFIYIGIDLFDSESKRDVSDFIMDLLFDKGIKYRTIDYQYVTLSYDFIKKSKDMINAVMSDRFIKL